MTRLDRAPVRPRGSRIPARLGAVVVIAAGTAVLGLGLLLAGHRQLAPGAFGGQLTAVDLLVGGAVVAVATWWIRKACRLAITRLATQPRTRGVPLDAEALRTATLHRRTDGRRGW